MTKTLFKDLPANEQEKFFEEIRESIQGDTAQIYIPEYISETLEKELEELGFTDVEILYSGFWSQGDGASFTGRITYGGVKNILNVDYDLIPEDLPISIERGGSLYVHENSTSVIANYQDVWDYVHELSQGGSAASDEDGEAQLDELINKLEKWVVKKNQELYGKIQEFYEGSTSDESVRQYIEDYAPEFELIQDEPRWEMI